MTTTPEEPEYEPWSAYLLRTAKNVLKVFAGICAISIAIAVAAAGYDQLDVGGYIHHDQTLDVYMSNDWLVGENRDCSLTEYPDANGRPTGKLLGLMCPMDDRKLEPHNLSVTFKGVLDPKDKDGKERPIPEQWKCTRGSDKFTCKAAADPAKPSTL